MREASDLLISQGKRGLAYPNRLQAITAFKGCKKSKQIKRYY